MQTEKVIFARALLLEQFENGVGAQKAIENVISEWGREALDLKEATYWYIRFGYGIKNITNGASPAIKKCIQNGTYLRSMRGVVEKHKRIQFDWLPFPVVFPTLQDDKLFGFKDYDLESIIEYSLTDQITREHKIEKYPVQYEYHITFNHHVWVGDKLLVGVNHRDWTHLMSKIILFDMVDLKWKKTNYEMKGFIIGLSYGCHLLTVSTCSMHSTTRIYQFQHTGTDLLMNTIWNAVRRYSQYNAKFYEWFQTKLPQSSKSRPHSKADSKY
ncbi:hypothetical protein M3Y95_00890500 [Aphelenchoides besseyi]|nr:hypothetical protein M3Y95_00890500 [Aphelenchoides besseyi]